MEKGKTYMARPADIERNWYVVDAEGKVLGRLAAEIATIIRGKHKPQFTPHMDTGDFVIVINAEKVKLTGKKREQKTYYWHTGYPGGLRSQTVDVLLEKKPEEVIRKAVWGMMPKNSLSRNQMKKLKVYAGPEHPHMAQMPQPLNVQEAAK
ncbi:MAG: 50S ribosomal protein L13 [Firmicutes bacterium]|nr:50S ribosomal protein L13 [Bacillota bacterium]